MEEFVEEFDPNGEVRMFTASFTTDSLVLFYLLISILWLCISVIITLYQSGTECSKAIWIAFSVLLTIIYIALALYYAKRGERSKLEGLVIATIIFTIVYFVVLAIVYTVRLL